MLYIGYFEASDREENSTKLSRITVLYFGNDNVRRSVANSVLQDCSFSATKAKAKPVPGGEKTNHSNSIKQSESTSHDENIGANLAMSLCTAPTIDSAIMFIIA